jgi:NodT family efflux transporter outer membrane factor (OMF) lipoprotein
VGTLAQANDTSPFNVFQAGFDASWELDLWGQARREVEAADASVDIQADARRDLLLSTMAEVARDYIQLRGIQSDYAITLENLNAARHIETVTREQNAHGLATELDVAQAASQVSSEAALLPQLKQQEEETINRLSFLPGEAPGALQAELESSKPVPPTPPVVPIGMPSELARRRPDIRKAEANLHQATAQIGVAQADFYPTITISGSASLRALQFSQLGNRASHQFAIGPSVSLPIFAGGRLKGTAQASQTAAAGGGCQLPEHCALRLARNRQCADRVFVSATAPRPAGSGCHGRSKGATAGSGSIRCRYWLIPAGARCTAQPAFGTTGSEQ